MTAAPRLQVGYTPTMPLLETFALLGAAATAAAAGVGVIVLKRGASGRIVLHTPMPLLGDTGWAEVADRRGLELQTLQMIGVIDGLPVVVSNRPHTTVSIDLPVALPRGLTPDQRKGLLGPRAPSPDAAAVLEQDGVSESFEHWMYSVRCQGDQLHLVADHALHGDVDGFIGTALGVARRLVDARLRGWSRALELGLTPASEPWRVQGQLDGGEVRVRFDFSAGTTDVEAPCPPGLPPGLEVHRGTSSLGHPMLDRMVAVTPASEEVRRILTRDRVLEPLLEIVHAYPGSRVTTEGVQLRLPTASPGGLERHLARVSELVHALGAGGLHPDAVTR